MGLGISQWAGLGWSGGGAGRQALPASLELCRRSLRSGISRGQAWEAEPDRPVRCITDPVREAVLIKFGSIIAGFVLWSHYGFNLDNLSLPISQPPLRFLPQPGCDLRTIPGIFSTPLCRGFIPAPPMGSWRQDGVGRGREARIEDVM